MKVKRFLEFLDFPNRNIILSLSDINHFAMSTSRRASSARALAAMESLCDDLVRQMVVSGKSAHLSVPASSMAIFDETTQMLSVASDATREREVATSRSAILLLQQMRFLIPFLRAGKSVTQRELYYLSKQFFVSYNECIGTLQALSNVLGVSRFHLGVLASARGSVAGHVRLRRRCSGGAVERWSSGTSATLPITSAVFEADFECEVLSGATCILVVEKEGIFQRLVEDSFFLTRPCVIVTAKGFPDLASRALVHKLHASAPELPVVGLCDWNPFGLGVLLCYKHGSIRFACDEKQWCVPALKWLGMRKEDVERRSLAADFFQTFSDVDESRARGLLASEMLRNAPAYLDEVEFMLERRAKLELESIFCSTDHATRESQGSLCSTRDPGKAVAGGGGGGVRVSSFERWLHHKLTREEWV